MDGETRETKGAMEESWREKESAEEQSWGKKKVPPLWEDFNEHVGVSIGTGGTSLEGKIMWLLVC